MGSLFKTREIWSVKLDDEEGFHCNSLILANIDNEENGSDKIIVASLKGILRVYNVRSNEYTANDLLIESDFGSPILQVAAGRLLPASSNLTLAILHPRKMSVYSISGTAGLSEEGSNYNILLMYEHILQRSAFNMTLGPFGQVKGKDFICIQALDGTLSFYEQESFAFSRFLPNYLLPGPFCYDTTNDCFIVATVSRTIESYRYHILAIAKDDEDTGNNKRIHAAAKKNIINRGRRVAPDWVCMIGENCLDISIIEATTPSIIIVLGEHNLFIMNETGELKYSRKFDFNPLCMCSYLLPNSQVMLLIVSEYNSLLVFNYTRIKWIAQMSCKAICISRGTINSIAGILTCLSDTGDLTSFYLGTNPSFSFANVTPSFHEINFEKSSQELKMLKKTIRSFDHPSVLVAPGASVNTKTSSSSRHLHEDISIVVEQVHLHQDEYTGMMNVTLRVTLSTNNNKVSNVRVSHSVSKPLLVDRPLIVIDKIDSNSSFDCKVTISSNKNNLSFLPSSLEMKICLIYHLTSSMNVSMVREMNYLLPLSLIANFSTSNLSLNALFKCNFSIDIITTSKLNMNKLLLSDEALGDEVTLQFAGDVDSSVTVTLVTKKMLEKLLLKSSSYESLNVTLSFILQRCTALNYKFDSASLEKESLQLNQFYDLIDRYSRLRDLSLENENNLQKQSSFFKCIIKRILIKLKDRNSSSLNQLDVMLDRVHCKLLALTDEAIILERDMSAIVNSLHTAGTLIAQLLAIVTSMKSEQATLLRNVFETSDNNYDSNREWGTRCQLALRDLPSIKSLESKIDLNDVNDVMFTPEKMKSLVEIAVDLAYKGDLFEKSRITPSASSETSPSPPPPGPAIKANFIGPTNKVIPEEDEDEAQVK